MKSPILSRGAPPSLKRWSAALPRPRLPTAKLALTTLALLLLSFLFGLLALSGSLVQVGLGAAMVIGPLLLMLPELTVWIILVSGMLLGILSSNPHMGKLTWSVSLLSILLLLPSIMNVLWTRQRRLPSFMQVALLFLVFCVCSTAFRGGGLQEFLAGFKRYFQTFGLMLALTAIVFRPSAIDNWRKFLVLVGLLQFPFALYELLILVPKRGGLASGSDATDVVAGTFGANIGGGSPNAVMVIYLFITMAFLAARWRAGLLRPAVFYALTFVCLLPLGMGETKVAVVMLPLVGLSLLRPDLLKAPLRYAPAILGLGLLTCLLGYLYVVVMMHSNLSEVIDKTLRYNVGNQGYSQGQILNRLTSFTFWFTQQRWDDPVGFLIGNGLGSSYSSLTSVSGHLGVKYMHYGINLTAASTLLWDTGLVGLALFVSVFVLAWLSAGRLYRHSEDAAVKADALAIQAAITLFMLSIVYADSIVNLVGMEMIYALVLGYLGYLMQQQGLLGKRAAPAPHRTIG
ncbi:hypothetical protein [Rugamonas sp. DEMB1]|uniref:hypothetical protein n=1 Tax=Rugamonas sp. DEMB1 TaxID=3039386 RepID=UPI002447C492|nr:hypothetical protein [Rugamonas sp. DEMB1]WGG49142.1 hypothetical protein QC826_21385 [Rugamonas sp. DEMB1]